MSRRQLGHIGRRLGISCGVMLLARALGAEGPSSSKPLLTNPGNPEEFGTQDYTVTTISALSFVPSNWNVAFAVSPSFGRYCACAAQGMRYYASLNLPAGSEIDYVGLNSTSDTDGVLGVGLWLRLADGTTSLVTGFSAPAHGWSTDLSGLINFGMGGNKGIELVLEVEQAASPNPQFFARVEVWWRRRVSHSLAVTFNDVPFIHPFHQYVEALAASGITAGCGNGNYCPGDPVTRGQIAVFLAKALGLHWPN